MSRVVIFFDGVALRQEKVILLHGTRLGGLEYDNKLNNSHFVEESNYENEIVNEAKERLCDFEHVNTMYLNALHLNLAKSEFP